MKTPSERTSPGFGQSELKNGHRRPAGRRMLLVNFGGIGNGLMVLPLMKALEQAAPDVAYYHVHNPALEIDQFVRHLALKRFLGCVPSQWRRFDEADWPAIEAFLERNGITHVISLRNEGLARDAAFARFLQAHAGIEFWHMEHLDAQARDGHLLEMQTAIFAHNGIDLRPDWNWMRALYRPAVRLGGPIGFFTGASQQVKQWRTERWIELGRMLLKQSPHDLVIYAGTGVQERASASEIYTALSASHRQRCSLVADLSLYDLAAHFAGLRLLVSNDTFSVHAAASLGVPTVGLYFSTVARIWGGMDQGASAVQSAFGLSCPWLKADAGNCEFYYGDCPAPCKDEVTASRVFECVSGCLAESPSCLVMLKGQPAQESTGLTA